MSYEPRSLNPNIMEKRINDLSKAVGGGGIGNIPIASSDTVGGIMIGGSANPITITGSGNASVRKATSELLGVVKAGDGVSIDADGAISGVVYSTTEHKTGRKWLDGRDIYEKTIQYESPYLNIATNGTTVEASTGVDFAFNAQAIDPTYKSSTPIKIAVESNNLKGYAFDAQFTAETVTFEYVKPVTP